MFNIVIKLYKFKNNIGKLNCTMEDLFQQKKIPKNISRINELSWMQLAKII